MNAKSFFAGAVFGVTIALTIAAANTRTPTWEYTVQTRHLGYATTTDWFYGKALTESATNGWEVLSSRRTGEDTIEIILKRQKQ